MLLVEGADAEQRPRDGDAGLLGEGLELLLRVGDQDPVAGEDERALGGRDLPGCRLELLGMPFGVGTEARQGGDDVVEGGMLGVRLGLEGVLGDVDVDRSGAAVRGDVERLGDDPRDVVGRPDQVVVLGHRQRDAGDVDLLERVLADQGAGHVAGDRDHRHRVELRRRDRGHEVRRARAAGAHAHADPAARAGIPVGRVAAALLVADEHVADLGVVAEDVVDREDDAARIAEEHVRALTDERLHEGVRADPGPLGGPHLVEHRGPRALDVGGRRRPVARDVAPALRRTCRRFALRDRHPWSLRPIGPATARTCKDPRHPARVPSVFGGRRPSGARPSVSLRSPAGSR